MCENKKKKLLITASTFPRYEKDTEPRFVLDLAKALQKYFDVTVLAPASPEALERECLEGVAVERYHYFPVHRWETLCYPGAIVPRIREKKVRAFLVPFLVAGLYLALRRRRKQYDCVHANWLVPQGIVQSFLGTPYVLTGHGGDVTSLNQKWMKNLKRRAVRRAKAVTVVSEALKEEVLAFFPAKEREEIARKLYVRPMGCDTARFGAFSIPKGEGVPPAEGVRTVLFVGRLAEKKGVQYLIEAMRWVDARLVIVGDGPLGGALRRKAARMGMEGKVVFLGAKTHEELPEIYASADVFCAPSVTAADRDKEGFGLVILEAMASGLPVVASRSGGITELVRDGWNGLLVEERDSRGLAANINRVFTDPEIYSRLIVNMRDTVRKYDYSQVGREYADIIGREHGEDI